MAYLSWMVLGLIVGFVGSKMVDKTGSGLTLDLALGVVGGVVGGYIGALLRFGVVSGVNVLSLVLAVGGAVVVLLVYRKIAAPS